MIIDILKQQIPSCCDIAVAAVDSYKQGGQERIRQFLPSAHTVVVLAHHVTASLEWAWFPFESERHGTSCAADLHAKAVIEWIHCFLLVEGHESVILPYPGSCGIAFKQLAAGTRLGEIGDSFLFLHHQWGPWVHLRVLLTDVEIYDADASLLSAVCLHCERCLQACPSKAITPTFHDLQGCKSYQLSEEERLSISGQYLYKCEVCARACPLGEQPEKISIRGNSSGVSKQRFDKAAQRLHARRCRAAKATLQHS